MLSLRFYAWLILSLNEHARTIPLVDQAVARKALQSHWNNSWAHFVYVVESNPGKGEPVEVKHYIGLCFTPAQVWSRVNTLHNSLVQKNFTTHKKLVEPILISLVLV